MVIARDYIGDARGVGGHGRARLRMNAPSIARDDRTADSDIADVAMIRYASVSRVIGESQLARCNDRAP